VGHDADISSFFFIAAPRLLAASISSLASFSAMLFSERAREPARIQRIASDVRRFCGTSIGTW